MKKLFLSSVIALCACAQAMATDLNVDAKGAAGGKSFATLVEAINAASGGDVILLAPGEYKYRSPSKPINGRMLTIRPANNAAGLVTVRGIGRDCSFIRFENLVIPESVRVQKSQWTQFVRCKFAATTNVSFWGVSFLDSEHCGLYGCSVQTLSGSQVNFGGARHIDYLFNEVSNGNSDAFQGGGDDILIEGNWVHDMHPTPQAHPDGIQLTNTRRLTVRGNVFDTWNTQTFFFSWTQKETTYEDFVIENNVCTTARYHGLTTHPSTDMVIRNNLFICDAQHPDGIAAIDLKNMRGKLTVQNNIFWQLGIEVRSNDVIDHNLYMRKHWHDGLPGTASVLTTPEACFIDRAARDYRLKEGSPAIGTAPPGTVPATDILGRTRSKTNPSIGPIEPQPGDEPFMKMWQTYFRNMQAQVRPPEPNT